MTAIRINRYIASAGYCSRRQADRLIESGRVTINGEIAELGTQIRDGDLVQIDGKPINDPAKIEFVYLAFNKPAGIICTSNQNIPNNIIDYINFPERIFTAGRLDRDSRGLILLTNDGGVINPLIHARNQEAKEYRVRVDQRINNDFILNMANGVQILDSITLPAKIKQINNYEFLLEIKQGLNRQIRRMCEALGYKVLDLQRTRIMDITLDGLKEGEWRYLTAAEISRWKSLRDNN